MGKLYIKIDDDVDKRFRKKIVKDGFKRGLIKRYIEDLIIKDLEKDE